MLERCDELLGSPRRDVFSCGELDIPADRSEEGNSVDKEYVSRERNIRVGLKYLLWNFNQVLSDDLLGELPTVLPFNAVVLGS